MILEIPGALGAACRRVAAELGVPRIVQVYLEQAGRAVPRPKSSRKTVREPATARAAKEGRLRIIGGTFRGRYLIYQQRPGTRPMKHRLREATFNLVGPAIKNKHAVDLFAGSGALGLEAISRGAASATLVERHVPTADLIRRNIIALGIEDRAGVVTTSAFVWADRHKSLPSVAWVVFCSPPYDAYVAQQQPMLRLLRRLTDEAPEGSTFVVEADDRFDFSSLPQPQRWDVRCYRPARLAILRA